MAAVKMKEYSMLEQLAPELLVQVLACIDIRDVLELTACNSFYSGESIKTALNALAQYFVSRRSAL
jgi:hypothetical protein